jgi:hypothetical protein
LYEIALVGDPSMSMLFGILIELDVAVSEAKLEMGKEVRVSINPDVFRPNDRTASVLVFLGGPARRILTSHGFLRTPTCRYYL